MKKLGVYIGETVYGHGDTAHAYVEKNTFVWYETVRSLTAKVNGRPYGSDVYDLSIWSLKYGYPTRRGPDAKLKTTEPKSIENTVIPIKEVADKYYIEWWDKTWRIQECTVHYDYNYDYEHVTDLKVKNFGSNPCHWSWEGEQAMSTLKNATVVPTSFGDMMREEFYKALEKEERELELKKSLEKSALNSCYGMGGFTTSNTFVSNRILEVNEALKIWENKNKETETMEKKTMTETDTFLKHINGITITSTYSKLDFGNFGDPYYIYYPEMEITEDMADTLLTVLLMAKREYIHKVVFNPEKGTTTIDSNHNGPVTVRCKDAEFDYILGYNMARTKMWVGSDDYNWFNKIKSHRKTHIEYTEKKPTEPKAKKTSKKGGKK